MKSIALVIMLALASATCWGADLEQPYQPTRAEWLRLTLTDTIRSTIGSWRLRVHTEIALISDGTEVVVVLTQSNGEPAPTDRVKANYVSIVRGAVERELKRYPWSSGMRVRVLFV